MRANFGNGGWVGVDGLGLPGPLYVRVGQEPSSGRLRIYEFYLDAGPDLPINGTDLRQLPLGRIEALINAHAEDVLKRAHYPAPDLSTYASYYVNRFGNYERQIKERNWVVISFADQLHPDVVEKLPSFARVQRQTRKWQGLRDADDEFRLSGGPVDGLTDEFLHEVARAYAAAVARGERPNVSIAAQTGYPRKSVQRWVYTARQRGIMPRGSKGRPG